MRSLKESIRTIIIKLSNTALLKWVPDAIYLKWLFWARMERKLNLKNPVSFNEKLQWLKLNDRSPQYTTMVDKHLVKRYVSDLCGQDYVIPLLGVWNDFDEIDFDSLPNQFVLKCTHDSAGLIICRDKKTLNIEAARQKIKRSMKKNYYWHAREWPYKNVKPRILAEKYIHDDSQGDNDNLIVYKIFNFEGAPTLIQVITNDKSENESIDYFDTNWSLLDLRQNFPNSKRHLNKPSKLEEMLELSRKLSAGFHFLRVDFYEVGEQVLFSEFTFFSDAGVERFYPEEWDFRLGKLIDLSTDYESK